MTKKDANAGEKRTCSLLQTKFYQCHHGVTEVLHHHKEMGIRGSYIWKRVVLARYKQYLVWPCLTAYSACRCIIQCSTQTSFCRSPVRSTPSLPNLTWKGVELSSPSRCFTTTTSTAPVRLAAFKSLYRSLHEDNPDDTSRAPAFPTLPR